VPTPQARGRAGIVFHVCAARIMASRPLPAAMPRVAHTFRRPSSECMRPCEWAPRHAKERHVCATPAVGPNGVRPGASAAGPYKPASADLAV
jgi:hypothetical protein